MNPELDTNPGNTQDDLDPALRRLAGEIHPRQAFVTRLRGELAQGQARQQRPVSRRGLTWLRPWFAQAGTMVLLLGLVLFALILAPRMLGQPTPVPALAGTPSAIPPRTPPFDPYGDEPSIGALARLGQGQLHALDTTPDGQLIAGSSTGVCRYSQGLARDWCTLTSTAVLEVEFCPAQGVVAAGLAHGSVQILDFTTGEVRAERQFENGSVTGLACDPDGASIVAVGTVSGQVSLWDWEIDNLLWGPIQFQDSLNSLDWARAPEADSRIALTDGSGMAIVSAKDGEILSRRDVDGTRQGPLAFINQGQNIAVALYRHAEPWLSSGPPPARVEVISLEGDQVLHTWQLPGEAEAMAVAPANEQGESLAVLVRDMDRRPVIALLEPGLALPITQFEMRWSGPLAWKDGSLYLTGDHGSLVRLEGDQLVPINIDYTSTLEGLAWPLEDQVITANYGSLRRWQVETGAAGALQEVRLDRFATLRALSIDGKHAAYYRSAPPQLTLWDVENNQPTHTAELPEGLITAAFDLPATRLALAFQDGSLWILNAQDGTVLRQDTVIQAGNILSLAWGPAEPKNDPLFIAWLREDGTGGITEFQVSGLAAGQAKPLVSAQGALTDLAISPDGKWMAASLNDHEVGVWDAASGGDRYILQIGEARASLYTGSLAFSPDSRLLAATGRNEIQVFDFEVGHTVNRFFAHSEYIPALDFRPDGKALASGSSDGLIEIWDLGAGPLPEPIQQPTPTPLPVDEEPIEATSETVAIKGSNPN